MTTTAVAPDYQALREALPYEIVPTRLPGVFTSPPPPADLDLHKADAKTLAKHGALWRPPKATERPAVRALWDRITSRTWEPIVPTMEVQFGRTHRIKNLKKTETGYTNSAWAGGVLNGAPGSYTSAIGTWVIPTVGIPREPQGHEGGWNSSSWVGIDGFFTTNDVLQAGIEQRVDARGNASYVAWYEWFVQGGDASKFPYIYQVNITNFKVSPGDKIYCSVQYVNKTAGQLYLANDTTGQTPFSITLAPPTGASFNGSCGEWIMEAPDGGEPVSALPSFSPVVFQSALACNGSVIGNPQNGDYVNVLGPNNQQLTSVNLGNDEVTIDFIG